MFYFPGFSGGRLVSKNFKIYLSTKCNLKSS